jgi:hypothetical protein
MKVINFNNLRFEEYIQEQSKYFLDQETMFRMRKIGYAPLNFDADSKTRAKEIARRLLKSKYNKGRYKIFFRKSSSRRGYHFFVFKDGLALFLPVKKVLRIRKIYKDCYGRLRADRLRAERGMVISILFHHKSGKSATPLRELNKLSDL